MKCISALCGLLSFMLAGSFALAADIVRVVDAGNHPIANATVLLGYEVGNPFPGNSLITDASGAAAAPSDWKAALPVTVQAAGYITTTIPVAMPGRMTIQLTPQEGTNQIEIKGITDGFGTIVDNGRVQFGLVIPALNRQQMLAFDMSTVLSPQTDTISVLGQNIDIPSNLTLPDQTVTYIFPIRLNKPEYRSYVRNSGRYQMSGIHGSFPLQKVVNDIKAGKSIFEVVNSLSFTEGGQRDVDVHGNLVGQDVNVNQIPFNSSISVTAPTYANNQVMMSLALSEQANGLMMPTDLKRINSGQSLALKSHGNMPSALSLLLVDAKKAVKDMIDLALDMISPLSVSKALDLPVVNPKLMAAQSFQQLSFALTPAKNGAAPQFLPLISPPVLENGDVLKMNVPATLPNGLVQTATYMVLTEIETFGSGHAQSEQRTRLWEVWSPAWLSQVELPKLNFPRNPNRKYRWEVMFLAQPANLTGGTARVNGVDLQSVTHVTRNTLEF